MALNYPPKPWKNGQRASLLPGMEFMYSLSSKKWVPITPGYENEEQLQESFSVSTIVELANVFKEETAKTQAVVTRVDRLDSDIVLSGRIWKTDTKPVSPNKNDVWMDPNSGVTFTYNASADAWIQQR